MVVEAVVGARFRREAEVRYLVRCPLQERKFESYHGADEFVFQHEQACAEGHSIVRRSAKGDEVVRSFPPLSH